MQGAVPVVSINFDVRPEQLQLIPFENISEGCYYPAVALFNYSRVEINMTTELKYKEVLTEFNALPFIS